MPFGLRQRRSHFQGMDTTTDREVTAEEICTLVDHYLPGGAARATVDAEGEFVVEWQSSRVPACRYQARSNESFDEALHLLVARSAALRRARAARRGPGNGKMRPKP
jgi:hypothetical protein